MQDAKLKNYFLLHFIVFIWGFTAILGALISIDALPLVWFRMVLAVGFIGIWIAYRKINLTVSRKLFWYFMIAGIVIAMHWVTFFKAIKVANVSITLATMSAGAFFTALLEPIWYKRKIIVYEVAFGLFVVLGLYIIFEAEGSYAYGILLALISTLLSSIFTLINGKLIQRSNPSVISFYELGGGVLFLTIYMLILGGFGDGFFDVSTADWMYLIILASICTAYAFIASVKVMRFISPFTVMLTINLEPVYGILLAYLILGDSEKMSPRFYLGALIILITVIANGIIKNRQKRKSDLS